MSLTKESLQIEINEAYAESFMKPEIKSASCLVIDGDHGSIVVDRLDEMALSDFDGFMDVDYMSQDEKDAFMSIYSNHGSDIYSVESKDGFMYRLSASGFMDSTDWSFAETEEEAMKEVLAQAD